MKTVYRRLALFLAVLFALSLVSCGSEQTYADSVFTGMDTVITLRLAAEGMDNETLGKASADVQRIVADLENILSCHKETSELSALNREVYLHIEVDETLLTVLNTAFQMHALTGGAYDPTLGALTKLWNVSGGGPVPDEDAIAEALSHKGTDKLTSQGNSVTKNDPAMQIDLGGLGKGYALQQVLAHLASTDIPYGLVSMGGNIGVFGQKTNGTPFQIGIKDPHDTSTVVGYMYIPSGFVSVSGNYERYFREEGKLYHHILDPETGYPAETGLSSVAVYAQNGSAADALSTALYVMGLEEGMTFYESGQVQFEAVFITEDNRIIPTPGLLEDGMLEITAENYVLAAN
ncbi:MAG: FAD:protein FMN transferase [Clostridia bacterium]|nr:FAD:protein FMN transferase [Clostridia bacterium]